MALKLIATAEIPATANYFDFTSIPQTYTDLLLVFSVRTASPFVGLSFNNVSSSYLNRRLEGSGSAVGGEQRTDTYIGPGAASSTNGYTANAFSNGQIYIPNYTSNAYKSFSVEMVSENNASTAYQIITGGIWSNNSAISSIQLYEWWTSDTKRDFVQYSAATLYGITAGSDGTTTVS